MSSSKQNPRDKQTGHSGQRRPIGVAALAAGAHNRVHTLRRWRWQF